MLERGAHSNWAKLGVIRDVFWEWIADSMPEESKWKFARRVVRCSSKVAVSIDRDFAASKILLIRGTIRADTVEGIAPEYAAMIRRTMSEEDAEALLKEAARLYRRMTRFFIHPDWVGILDFETRLPSAVERAMERAANRHDD